MEYYHDYVFETVLAASTVHITEEDAEFLSRENELGFPVVISFPKGEYGVLVRIEKDRAITATLEDLRNADLSEGFQEAYLQAWARGCDWLDLDQDGPAYRDLPKHDW